MSWFVDCTFNAQNLICRIIWTWRNNKNILVSIRGIHTDFCLVPDTCKKNYFYFKFRSKWNCQFSSKFLIVYTWLCVLISINCRYDTVCNLFVFVLIIMQECWGVQWKVCNLRSELQGQGHWKFDVKKTWQLNWTQFCSCLLHYILCSIKL